MSLLLLRDVSVRLTPTIATQIRDPFGGLGHVSGKAGTQKNNSLRQGHPTRRGKPPASPSPSRTARIKVARTGHPPPSLPSVEPVPPASLPVDCNLPAPLSPPSLSSPHLPLFSASDRPEAVASPADGGGGEGGRGRPKSTHLRSSRCCRFASGGAHAKPELAFFVVRRRAKFRPSSFFSATGEPLHAILSISSISCARWRARAVAGSAPIRRRSDRPGSRSGLIQQRGALAARRDDGRPGGGWPQGAWRARVTR
jgi:hypothetical protein